jgi:hypothetical protein
MRSRLLIDPLRKSKLLFGLGSLVH